MSEAVISIASPPIKSIRKNIRYKKDRNVGWALEYANTSKSFAQIGYDTNPKNPISSQAVSKAIAAVIRRRDVSEKIIEKIEKKRRGN